MSNIKLVHSGGNSVSITAPDSNPASNRTLKLPSDENGQIITSDRSGTTLQRQFKYLTSSSQLAKGGAIGELNTDLRIDFTPKAADSNLLMEFDASYVFPNSANIQYCLFYDNTASAGVDLPPTVGSRVRCHWTNRNRPYDANDNVIVRANYNLAPPNGFGTYYNNDGSLLYKGLSHNINIDMKKFINNLEV